MTDKKAWVLAILAIFGLCACATMQSGLKEPPLPNDVNIIPPSPDLPKNIATFSGKWVGMWDSGVHVILVVEEIHETWAQVIYSRADNPGTGAHAGYFRFRCRVTSDREPKIVMDAGQGRLPGDTIFEVWDSNTLVGHVRWMYGTAMVSLQRAD